MAKKSLIGVIKQKDAVIGHIQYKNNTEVEIWFKEGCVPAGMVTEKSSKKIIGTTGEIAAKRVACKVTELRTLFSEDMQFIAMNSDNQQHIKVIDSLLEDSAYGGSKGSQTSFSALTSSPPASSYVQASSLAMQQNFNLRFDSAAEGIYGNAETLLEQKKKTLSPLSADSEIKILGCGAFGMVLRVETQYGSIARKIDISEPSIAENIKLFDAKQQNEILHKLFNEEISYATFVEILRAKKTKETSINFAYYYSPSYSPPQDDSRDATIFSNEQVTLLLLGGDHLAKVYCINPAMHAYDMELCKSTLSEELKSPDTKPEDKKKMIARLSDCVTYMTTHNVIHNDLHSGNILVRQDGSLVVSDPGKSSFTRPGAFGADFRQDGMQYHLLHPNRLVRQVEGKKDDTVDTIYNDAWSFCLLIGEILGKDIQYRYFSLEDAKDSTGKPTAELAIKAIYEIAAENIAIVKKAISDSFLSEDQKKILLNKVDILMHVRNMDELILAHDSKPDKKSNAPIYASRQVLLDALAEIKSTVEHSVLRIGNSPATYNRAPPSPIVSSVSVFPFDFNENQKCYVYSGKVNSNDLLKTLQKLKPSDFKKIAGKALLINDAFLQAMLGDNVDASKKHQIMAVIGKIASNNVELTVDMNSSPLMQKNSKHIQELKNALLEAGDKGPGVSCRI